MLENKDNRVIYFLGIGGIGMSALARYFHSRGARIHGYDRVSTDLTRELESLGMHIHYQEDEKLIPEDLDLAIWTPAIPAESLELQKLKGMGSPLLKRSEVLGEISRETNTIAVAGTHGKTSTSSMIAYLLTEAGLAPHAFLGGIATNFNSNYVAGKSDLTVMEADEFDRSFWRLCPYCSVVTSMDPDHLDIYGDYEEMTRSYMVFLEKTDEDGILIYHHSLEGYVKGLETGCRKYSYGVDEGMCHATNVSVEDGVFKFDFVSELGMIENIHLEMPGQHNVENMVAAISVALIFGVGPDQVADLVKGFKGIKRRFELTPMKNGRTMVNDYAHHPKELEAAIDAAEMLYPGKMICGVFQPHLYSRTRDFAKEFATALDRLNIPVLIELYPAREEPIAGISSETIYEKMKNRDAILTEKKKLINTLKKIEFDVLMILGAGDLDVMIPGIIHELDK